MSTVSVCHYPITRLWHELIYLPLDIRDFPKSAAVKMLDITLKGLRNCVNLRACSWTRDGSLNSNILQALQTLDSLQELEINGHDDGNYDPDLLKGFTGLTRISLIMPSAAVIHRLRSWIGLTGSTLQTLMLICKVSTLPVQSLFPLYVSSLDIAVSDRQCSGVPGSLSCES
jgi:hypothetical protein